jgi:hypothetical protein
MFGRNECNHALLQTILIVQPWVGTKNLSVENGIPVSLSLYDFKKVVEGQSL